MSRICPPIDRLERPTEPTTTRCMGSSRSALMWRQMTAKVVAFVAALTPARTHEPSKVNSKCWQLRRLGLLGRGAVHVSNTAAGLIVAAPLSGPLCRL